MAGEKIRNVGPKGAAWLRQVGVRTLEDLERVGPVDAFLKIKRAGFRPSLNLLYSMAGALADCHWTDVPDERKQELISALEAAESANPIKTRWERQRDASEGASPPADGDGEAPGLGLFDDVDGAAAGGMDGDRDLSRFD